MTDEERARLAEILEQVGEEGLHHPRDLDAALDAIDDEWKAALAAERERCTLEIKNKLLSHAPDIPPPQVGRSRDYANGFRVGTQCMRLAYKSAIRALGGESGLG